MNKLKQKYFSLDSDSRRAFWAILVIAVLSTIVVFVATLDDIFDPTLYWYARIAMTTPMLLALTSYAGAYSILMGNALRGGRLFIIGVFFTLIAIVASYAGVGFVAAALGIVLVSYVGLQVTPRSMVGRALAFALILGALLLLGDTFIPWPRVTSEAGSAQLWIAIGLLAMFVIAIGRQYNSFPLQSKLIFISLFLTIIPAALLGVMSAQNATRALETSTNKALLSSASQVAASVDTFILNTLDTLRVESQTPDFIEYLELSADERAGRAVEERVRTILRAFQNKDNIYILSYALVDRRGMTAMDTNGENVGKSQSSRMFFIEAMNTGVPYVSPVQINEQTSDSVIIFSAPVRNALGATVGVLQMTYKADILQLLLVQQGGIEGANTMLVDDNLIMLANRTNPDLMRKSISPLEDARVLVLQRLGVFPEGDVTQLEYELPELVSGLKNIDTQPTFLGEFHSEELVAEQGENFHLEQAAAVRTSTRPWYVVAMQSRQELLTPVTNLTRGVTILGVTTAIVGAFLAGLIAALVARPLEKLSEVATRLAEGDLSARAEITSEDEVGMLGGAFNNMSKQLSGLIGSLEQRVADRTRALATSTEVSRYLSTILDESQLVKEVVDQLQKAFDYYHVHIYLFDPEKERLTMVGGTGEAGQTMLERGHQISRGRGLVGRAAETAVPILVADVSKADGWLPNPLLPYTRAEMAVPILAGDQVLGVLDVQDDEVNGLQQSDADLLQSIANQVGVGLLNARSYKETQHRAQREAMVAAIGQRIQQTTSTEEALRVAVREVGRALGKPYTTVRLNVKGEDRPAEQELHDENNGHEN